MIEIDQAHSLCKVVNSFNEFVECLYSFGAEVEGIWNCHYEVIILSAQFILRVINDVQIGTK